MFVRIGRRTINLDNVTWINHDPGRSRNLTPEKGPAVEVHFRDGLPILFKGEEAEALERIVNDETAAVYEFAEQGIEANQ